LADALHQSGKVSKAQERFDEVARIGDSMKRPRPVQTAGRHVEPVSRRLIDTAARDQPNVCALQNLMVLEIKFVWNPNPTDSRPFICIPSKLFGTTARKNFLASPNDQREARPSIKNSYLEELQSFRRDGTGQIITESKGLQNVARSLVLLGISSCE